MADERQNWYTHGFKATLEIEIKPDLATRIHGICQTLAEARDFVLGFAPFDAAGMGDKLDVTIAAKAREHAEGVTRNLTDDQVELIYRQRFPAIDAPLPGDEVDAGELS